MSRTDHGRPCRPQSGARDAPTANHSWTNREGITLGKGLGIVILHQGSLGITGDPSDPTQQRRIPEHQKKLEDQKYLVRRMYYYYCDEEGNTLYLKYKSDQKGIVWKPIKTRSGGLYRWKYKFTKGLKNKEGQIIKQSKLKEAIISSPKSAAQKIYKKLLKLNLIKQNQIFYIKRHMGGTKIYKFKACAIDTVQIKPNTEYYKTVIKRRQKQINELMTKHNYSQAEAEIKVTLYIPLIFIFFSPICNT